MAMKTKGQVEALAILLFAFFLVLTLFVTKTMISNTESIDIFQNNAIANQTFANANALLSGLDYAFPTILIALNLFSVVMLFFLRTHPILFAVFLVLLPITIFLSASISNAYEDSLGTMAVASDFPITNFTMLYLPFIMFAFDLMGAIFLFVVMKGDVY